jgi:hypothetical protein
MSLLAVPPAYYGTATLRFDAGEKAIATEVQFVYHTLFRLDVDRVLRRFVPGGNVHIRFNPREPQQVHVKSTFPTAILLASSMPVVFFSRCWRQSCP